MTHRTEKLMGYICTHRSEEQGLLGAHGLQPLQDGVYFRQVLRSPLRRAAQNQVQARVPLAAYVPLAPQEGLLIVSHAAEEVTLMSHQHYRALFEPSKCI